MARRISRKELKQDEFVDAAVDAKHWLEQHWKPVVAVAAGALAVTLIVLAVVWNQQRTRAEAAGLLARGHQRFDAGVAAGDGGTASFEEALVLFDEAANKGGRSEIGHAARFFHASSLQQLGRLDEARSELELLVSDADLSGTLRDSSRALLATVCDAAGDLDAAIGVWSELADDEDTLYPSDQALFQLGWTYERNGDGESARLAWQRLVDEYPESPLVADARSLVER